MVLGVIGFSCDHYIHTLPKFLFLILKVLFLMKQVKHCSVFIYHTKYKSSGATLNTNLINKKLTQNDSLSHDDWIINSPHSFHQDVYIDIYIRIKRKGIQICNSIINLFQPYKMTFFRWMKYSYIFEYNIDRFTLLSIKKKKKINFF